MELTFLGATGTVTGSKYLLATAHRKILIDCGLFQGRKELRLRNWEKFPTDPSSLDFILLTHAHIDHTGYLPLIVKNGFKGPIYATKATTDLCKILLPDCGFLQEEDAKRANKYGYSKHHPALPLFTKEDALIALKQFVSVEYNEFYNPIPELRVKWHRAGHIIGASFVELQIEAKTILFSGDMGRKNDPVMKAPTQLHQADYLILESTYGNRLHENVNPQEQLADVINDTTARKGSVIIPAFAVGRAQTLLYYFYQLQLTGKINKHIPIYLDSPMAIDTTKLLCKHLDEHKLTRKICTEISKIVTYINTPEESKAIDDDRSPKIIISASGMATGGRILHHLKAYATDPNSTILLTGYQASETRGAKLLAGFTEIKIHGQMVPIRAKVVNLSNTSAHADYQDILQWLKQFTSSPRKVFLTHGEIEESTKLKHHIESQLGWKCDIPSYLSKEKLI